MTITQLVRIARGIEAGGHYNVSKLIWALVYAEEVRASNAAGIPVGEALHAALAELIADLRTQSAPPDLIHALENGLEEIVHERPSSLDALPRVFVSRTCGDVFVGERPAETRCDDDPFDLREFAPHYYLDPAPVPELLGMLRTFPATIAAVLADVDDALLTASPAPGEWSVHALLQHLDVTQGLLINRVRQILNEDTPDLVGITAWVLEPGADSTRDLLQRYAVSRTETLAILEPLQPEAWWRPARHSEFGIITLHEHVSYFARHERSHFRQLVQTVRALTA